MTAASTATRRLDGGVVGLTGLLSLAMAIATVPIHTLSVLSSQLRADLGISRAALGWLVAAISATTGLLAFTAGGLTDALGGRRALAVVFASGTVALTGVATASSQWWLLAAVVVAGVANATAVPATNKLLVDRLPPGRRGTAMGVKQSGVQVGQLAAGLLLPAAVVAVGWRGGVAALAALAGVGLLLTPRLVPAAALTEDRAAAVPRGRWRPTPGLWWLLAYAVVMGAASAPVIAFLPLFAQEALGLGLGAAGAAAASIGLVGIASRVLWTRGSERAAGYAPAMQLIAALAAAAVVLLLAATGAGSWLLWPAVALAGISLPGWYAVTLMAGVAEADRASVGRASGLVLVGYMTGYTLGPIMAGAALDAGGTYAGLWIGCAGLYGAALVLVAAWRRAGGRRLDPHQAA